MKVNSAKVLPFVIGLTGAIGTGKSLVRKMLEHHGALTIDADQLAHCAYAKGTAGFQALINRFGNEILNETGHIDRKRVGVLVFKNPQALIELEALIHPLVTQAVNRVIELSPLPIIVIEAIKLLESDLKEHCDLVWVVASPADEIYQRLKETRGMNRAQVDERLNRQPIAKIGKNGVGAIIVNQGKMKDLWAAVSEKWEDLSKNNKNFSIALAKTRESMAPFQSTIIQPDDVTHAQAISEINKNGLLFLPVKNLASENPQNIAEGFDPSCLEIPSFLYFLWSFEISSDNKIYLISDMDNFSASAAFSTGKNHSEEFSKIIGMVEDFSRLHLCEKLFFPFNFKTGLLADKLGYTKFPSSSLRIADLSPLEYNLLCKQLRAPLNLFREN